MYGKSCNQDRVQMGKLSVKIKIIVHLFIILLHIDACRGVYKYSCTDKSDARKTMTSCGVCYKIQKYKKQHRILEKKLIVRTLNFLLLILCCIFFSPLCLTVMLNSPQQQSVSCAIVCLGFQYLLINTGTGVLSRART